jgi:transposase-like protein
VARPSKLTPALRGRIALAVSGGASLRAAAQVSGVADSTLRSWLARGRSEQGARKRARGELPYVELLEAVERAGARAEVRAAALIAKAAETDWRAAAWYLERRDPETFGPPKLALEHTGVDGGPVKLDGLGLDLSKLSDRDLAALQRIAGRASSDA